MFFDFNPLRGLKIAAAGMALAGGLTFAGAANALNVTILDGTMDSPLVVNIAGIGAVLDAPVQFHTIYGSVPKTLLAWCVDVAHDITLGDYNPDLQYTDINPFDTSYPYAVQPFTAAEVLQVDTLVNYGTRVYADNSLSSLMRRTTLAAIQGAIWQVVSGRDVTLASGFSQNNGVNATSFNNLVDAFGGSGYASLTSNYGWLPTQVTFITPIVYPNGGTQSFLYAGYAPEPGAWALMIGGFALTGAMLRRRRAAAVAA
jgi:hypothetical protein